MKIIDELNELTQDKYAFRFKKATLERSSGVCYVELFYKDGVILSQKERTAIGEKFKQILPSGFSYDFKFVKNFLVNEAVKESTSKFLKQNFPAILFDITKVDCENENKLVRIEIDEKEMDYAASRKVDARLKEFLKSNFYSEIDVKLCVREAPSEIEEEEIMEELVFDDTPERFIEVHDVECVVGDLTDNLASYIKDKKSPEENVVFCGKIGFFKEASFEAKKTKKEEGEQSESGERKYFKFMLEDFTGKVNCIYFSNKKTHDLVAKLKSGDSIIVSGALSENKFNKGLDLKIKNISRCSLPEKFEEEIIFKSEPSSYKYVFPEPVEYYSQVDLFSAKSQVINPFFLDNDVVVFDFETTGLRLDGSDYIIEIGAVKLKKGKIVESFSCLIDPEIHIPEDATKTHGIKDEDVKGKPKYYDVLPDFYKFTRGCYLSGYNIIGFDMIFLTNFGKKSGYNFDNPVIDVYKIAQKNVKGVKNYKLITVAEKLGVALDHAHRAVYDTIATAEVLLKLSENIDNIENY